MPAPAATAHVINTPCNSVSIGTEFSSHDFWHSTPRPATLVIDSLLFYLLPG
jgi:hypothetical protein